MKTLIISIILALGLSTLTAQSNYLRTSNGFTAMGRASVTQKATKRQNVYVNSYDEAFVFGFPVSEHEGLRASFVDQGGSILLIDDVVHGKLIFRLNNVNTGYLNLRIYSSDSKLLHNRTLHHALRGTQMEVDYTFLPDGKYFLIVKTDHGTILRKKITKSPHKTGTWKLSGARLASK